MIVEKALLLVSFLLDLLPFSSTSFLPFSSPSIPWSPSRRQYAILTHGLWDQADRPDEDGEADDDGQEGVREGSVHVPHPDPEGTDEYYLFHSSFFLTFD